MSSLADTLIFVFGLVALGYLFGRAKLPPLIAKVAVIGAAMPPGVNPYLIATRFGTGQALASNTMTLTKAAGALTAAFWLVVVESVFG